MLVMWKGIDHGVVYMLYLISFDRENRFVLVKSHDNVHDGRMSA